MALLMVLKASPTPLTLSATEPKLRDSRLTADNLVSVPSQDSRKEVARQRGVLTWRPQLDAEVTTLSSQLPVQETGTQPDSDDVVFLLNNVRLCLRTFRADKRRTSTNRKIS